MKKYICQLNLDDVKRLKIVWVKTSKYSLLTRLKNSFHHKYIHTLNNYFEIRSGHKRYKCTSEIYFDSMTFTHFLRLHRFTSNLLTCLLNNSDLTPTK